MKADAPEVERIEVADATARLAELVAGVARERREVIFTTDDKPVARLIPPARLPEDDPGEHDGLPEPDGPAVIGTARGEFAVPDDLDEPLAFGDDDGDLDDIPEPTGPPKLGVARGEFVVPDDFDAPLDEFKEYM